MPGKTYTVPGIHEHAIEISALRLLVQLLLNREAWRDSATLAAAEEKHVLATDLAISVVARMDVDSDIPAENERIRQTMRRYVVDLLHHARPIAG